MDYRYEYNTIKEFLQNNYQEGLDYLLIAIEDISAKVYEKIEFFSGKNKLELNTVEGIYLIDLGKISLVTLQYRIHLLKYFEEQGVRIINSPETLLLCRNKMATYFNLKNKGLPTIPTMSLSSKTDYQVWYDFIDKIGEEIIVKPLLGSRGIGIEYLNISRLKNRLKNKLAKEKILIVQKFIHTKDMCDIRVLVIGNKVLACMKRCAKKGKFLTNIFQGGTPHPIELSKDIESMAIEACKAVNGDILTVDLIKDEKTDEIFILEINGFARWEGLQKVTDINITKEIIKYVMKVRS